MGYWQTQLTALWTIWRKEYIRIVRIWIQTLVPPLMTMALYFIIFGRLLGERLNTTASDNFVIFLMPGLIMMSVINNSFANVVSSFFSSKFQRHVEELLVAPVDPWVFIMGYSGGGVIRGFLVGTLGLILAHFFYPFEISHPFLSLFVFLAVSLLFSLAGLLNALFAKKFDDISLIPTFVLTPLTYFGGVFYAVEKLPEFWQILSHFNPIWYFVSLFRYAFMGYAESTVFTSLFLLVALIGLFWVWVLLLLRRGYGLRQ